MNKNHPRRRLFLGCLGLAVFAAPALASGCGAGFESISKIDSLRVLGVTIDKPYAAPGDTVTLTMSLFDGYVAPGDSKPSNRPVTVLWLGGCYDPPGDAYYGCYEQLGPVFASLKGADFTHLPAGVPVGIGETFKLPLPTDIISRRPLPTSGPHYGIAYVFFAACAGDKFGPAPPSGTGAAGSFPIGCFDAAGNRLGPESFVPGYTQVYAFEDGRTNENPVVNGFKIKDKPTVEPEPEGDKHAVPVKRCAVAEDQRSAQGGCGKKDPFAACESVKFDVDVPSDVAEVDPDGKTSDGKPVHEVVWVDYFAENGDIDSEVKLVSDATTGIIADHSTKWIPPSTTGLTTVWAVVHDGRGGETVITRYIDVQ